MSEGLGATVNWDPKFFCVAINKDVPYKFINFSKTFGQIYPDNLRSDNSIMSNYYTDFTGVSNVDEYGNGIPDSWPEGFLTFARQPVNHDKLKLFLQYYLPNDWDKAYPEIATYIEKYKDSGQSLTLNKYFSNRKILIAINKDKSCFIEIYKEGHNVK